MNSFYCSQWCLPDKTVTLSALGLVCPSLLVTVYWMAGAWPVKPGAGVKVTVPSDCTTTVPAVALVTGSTTGTGVGPAGYTTPEPGRVKLVTLTVVPGGTTALARMLVISSVPAVVLGLSLPSSSMGFTDKVKGTSTSWPSELATVTVTAGTGPM